ncbi:MAG: SDR family oxidoreductase [Chloroflexi bacterium]|nr:SDR family oxidoreductase [Chloroflexota bacterium]
MSKTKNILITGASGLLGANLVRHYAARHRCTGLYATHPISIPGADLEQINLTDHASISRTLERLQPDLIIHCAAATNVEWCEKHPELAKSINVDATLFLAERSSAIGAKFVFTSTDSVFDGTGDRYLESDVPAPLNAYATGKAHTEESVRGLNPDALIIRSYFYGYSPSGTRSLLEWVLVKAQAGDIVPGFTDSYFSPIGVYDFADALDSAVDADTSGILHMGSSDTISKYEIARMVMVTYMCDMSLLRPITVNDAGLSADRPRNTSLNVTMLESIWGRSAPSVAHGIERVALELNPFN